MDFDENFDPYDNHDGYEDEEDYCSNCGPWCHAWMGDNLCEYDLQRQEQQTEEFLNRYYEMSICPVCKKVLPQFNIPSKELWVWPGEWPCGNYYDPRIGGFEVYGFLFTAKGIIHSDGKYHHIWTGLWTNQKIIKLL